MDWNLNRAVLIKLGFLARQRDDESKHTALLFETLLKALKASTEKKNDKPQNYSVYVRERDGSWTEVQVGTRDFCIGYLEGSNTTDFKIRVGIEGTVIYPDDNYGDCLENIKSIVR